MATSARFGRLPRTAPSLSAQIVAAARQYEAMRERNLQDAWKNGGDFEGKKATDEMLLEYFNNKLKELDPNDPAANEVRNLIDQYEFSIANSEMELKYAQKKVSDGEMAAFYHKWAGKLPRNSEAWREREKLAAQYRDRASSGARAASGANRAEAYGRRQTSNYMDSTYVYDAVTSALLGAARSGIIGLTAPVLNTDKENWADLRVSENDATNFLEISNTVATDPALEGWRRKTTTAINAALQDAGVDTRFNGDFSYTGLLSWNRKATAGATRAIKIARNAGYSPSAYEKKRDELKGTYIAISTIDEKAIYEDARSDWEEVLNDATSTLSEQWEATNKYSGTLLSLANRAKAAGDDIGAGRYNSEYLNTKGDTETGTTPTMYEASRQSEASRSGDKENADGYTTALSVNTMRANLAKLLARDPATGAPLYAQVNLDSKGNPTTAKTGKFGVVPISSIPNAALTINTRDGQGKITIDGGSIPAGSIVTALMPTAVTATVVRMDPVTKQPVGTNAIVVKPTTIGSKFTLDNGTVVWSYKDVAGKTKYALDNPFNYTSRSTTDGEEIIIPAENDVAARNYKDKGVVPAVVINPDYHNPSSYMNTPNLVFDSVAAAEITADPDGSYFKYNSDAIKGIAMAESGGDVKRYGEIYGELDKKRAAYITGGDMTYDQKVRLRRNYENGDIPALFDQTTFGGPTRTEFGRSAEGIALGRELGKEMQGPSMYGGGVSPEEKARAQRARELFNRTQPGYGQNPYVNIHKGPGITAESSRAMANNLVGGIWQSVFSNQGVYGSGTLLRTGDEMRSPLGQIAGRTAPPPANVPKPTPPPSPVKPKPDEPPKGSPPPPKIDMNPYQNIHVPKPSAPKVNDFTGFNVASTNRIVPR